MTLINEQLLQEERLVEKLTHGKLRVLSRLTWEEDYIRSTLVWGTDPHFGSRPVDSCELYRLRDRSYLARVKIPLLSDTEKNAVYDYIAHMGNLCYGNDCQGRVTDFKVRERKNKVIVYFHIGWLDPLTHVLNVQGVIEMYLQKSGRHPLRN